MKKIILALTVACLLNACRFSGNSGQYVRLVNDQDELFAHYGFSLDKGSVYHEEEEREELMEYYRSKSDLYGLHVGKNESFIFKVQNPEFEVIEDSGCGLGDLLLVLPEYSSLTFFSGLPSYNMEKQKTVLKGSKVNEDGEIYISFYPNLNINEEYAFSFNGEKYVLYATTREDDESLEAYDYRIFLRKESDKTTQLLTHIEQLEHGKPTVCFAGDIDGDGKLDLLIDESRNYEHYKMKLFLSSFAEEGEFVKAVAAQEEWNGC